MSNLAANAFVTVLLNKNSDARLCGSYSNLKKHEFFQKIEWVNYILYLAWHHKQKDRTIFPNTKGQIDRLW